jgi:hypothetical protein
LISLANKKPSSGVPTPVRRVYSVMWFKECKHFGDEQEKEEDAEAYQKQCSPGHEVR